MGEVYALERVDDLLKIPPDRLEAVATALEDSSAKP